MITMDVTTLLNANSIIINSASKTGKVTFLLYLIKFLYKSKAIIFTPQESYLFYRRLDALSNQYPQFSNLKESIDTYFLDSEFNVLKQKYGYAFFLKELIHIIITSEEKVIVVHRLAEYFEFQDRYEIENIYKVLIRVASENDKKIIFLVNNEHENFSFIHRISEEFTDVSITITKNDKNERILNIKDVLHNVEHPYMQFRIHENNFILDLYEKNQKIDKNKLRNVLVAEIDKAHDNMYEICSYIFDKPNFRVKYADSLQSILQEVFISPDIIIVLMQREEKNFKTIAAIKKQLPDTSIVAILDQGFVRTEDTQKAYINGCDELFANNLSLESLILTFQKSSKTNFYSQSMESLPKYNNIMDNLSDFKLLAHACVERSLFFTAFTLKSNKVLEKITHSSRVNDYIYQSEDTIYYMAISTMPKDIHHIIDKYRKKYIDLELLCTWEPINHDSFDECIS